MKRAVSVVLILVLLLVLITISTIMLQTPPKYPTYNEDVDAYFEEYLPNRTITKEEMANDIDAVIDFTDEMHADPYRVVSREAFLDKAGEIKAAIDANASDDIPVIDAFYYLQELVAYLEDGHTTMFPLNWEKTVGKMFPLVVISIEERIFVGKNYGVSDIPERAEILAVNGMPIETIIDDIMKFTPGTLSHLKYSRFAERFNMWIQTYYDMQSPWEITYKYNGETKTTIVEGIDLDSFEKASTIESDFIEREIVIDGESVPVLEFVALGEMEWEDFKGGIDTFFSRQKDKEHLIIDIRHLPGGSGDWGYYVLSHLTSKPIDLYKEFAFKVSPLYQDILKYGMQSVYYEMKIPKFLWGLPIYKLVTDDDPEYWIARGVLESDMGTYYETPIGIYDAMYLAKDDSNKFGGKVYLLIDPDTFSAGTYFGGMFMSNDLGTVIGRETGGRSYMLSDMMPAFMPNSGLMYMVPVAKFVVSDQDPDRGIMPDYAVEFTAEDYINHRDPDMDKVIELIKEE